MEKYNPLIEPKSEEWLQLSEDDRLDAVIDFHENNEGDLAVEALSMHASIHVIVESQLAMGVELVPETMAKLERQGLDRHEAIHAIGAIIGEYIFNSIQGENADFSPTQYRRKLEKITAKRWRKGQY
jgi:hypothetical protein